MEESLLNLLRRIEQNNNKVTAQMRSAIAVGPFLALINKTTDMTWLNYAVPAAPLGTSASVAEAILELRRVFKARDRTLRFEFTEALWPELPAALELAGLQLEVRHPMMLCTPADLQPKCASGVQLRILAEDDTENLVAYLSVANQSFGGTPTPTAEAIASLREQLQSDRMRCVLALQDGVSAGAGCTTTPLEGICELAGVGTLQALRRRGVAATLSSFLVQDHFERGGDLVWLSAGDAIAQSLYQRIGFRLVDARLNYIAPTLQKC